MKKLFLMAIALAVGIFVLAAAYDNCLPMLTANKTAIANGTTLTTSTANAIDCVNTRMASLYLYCAGTNAASAGTVTFYFYRSPDNGTNWFELEGIPVTLNGVNQVTAGTTKDLDLKNTRQFRLGSVVSTDPTYTAIVNSYIQFQP